MRYIVLDTSAIIHIIRANEIGKEILNWINALNPEPVQVISVVTRAELLAFAKTANWERKKSTFLYQFLKGITIIDISNTDTQLIENYILIDSFSKNKAKDDNGNIKGGSHHQMGKNDLWIAATARSIKAILVTTDSDFNHLNNRLLSVYKI